MVAFWTQVVVCVHDSATNSCAKLAAEFTLAMDKFVGDHPDFSFHGTENVNERSRILFIDRRCIAFLVSSCSSSCLHLFGVEWQGIIFLLDTSV